MKLKVLSLFLSVVVILITAFMLVPLMWAVSEETQAIGPFAVSIGAGLAMAAALYALGKGARPEDMGAREAFAAVSFAWILASLQGCLPYIISGAIPNFTDAYFEAMSGFTTTGATILERIEVLPAAIQLWRCQTQWLGGMGIVVLTIAILPMLGVSVNNLFKAEVPGFQVEKLRPRMRDTAVLLWGVYMAVTVFGILLLLAAKMNFLDAVCHVFAAVSTGGFSTRDASVAAYDSAFVEWALTGMMFFCGANFNLLLVSIKKESLTPYKDPEFLFYTKIIVAASLIITAFVQYKGFFVNVHDSLRSAIFQVVSTITTTGFVAVDYGQWPIVTQIMLLFLMFVGGCSGSTAGGIKCSRILVVMKQIHAEMRRALHPNAVIAVRVGDRTMDNSAVASASAFITLYVCVFMASALIISATGQSVVTSLSGVAATLSNVGPGLGAVGPVENFHGQHIIAKWVYTFCMLCGRLELYTILVLFTKDAWRR